MLKQIDQNKWNRLYDAEPLCSMSFSVTEIEEAYGIEFFEYFEEGLGTLFGAFCIIDSHYLFLNGYGSKESKEFGIVIDIQNNNTDPASTVSKIVEFFHLKKSELSWVRENLATPTWMLLRQGEDGDEVEVTRFQTYRHAEYVMNEFSGRGHKQTYFIREIS